MARKKITPLYKVYWTLHDHSGMAEILLIEHKTPNNQASYQSDNDSRVQMLPPKSDLYSSISAMYKDEFVFFLPYLCWLNTIANNFFNTTWKCTCKYVINIHFKLLHIPYVVHVQNCFYDLALSPLMYIYSINIWQIIVILSSLYLSCTMK